MSTKKVAQPTAKEKPKPAPVPAPPESRSITLADVTVTWAEGAESYEASPEKIALALEYVWGILNDGKGNFDLLSDANAAYERLQAAEELVLAIADTQEGGTSAESPAFWALHDLIRDGRVRYDMSQRRLKPEAFRVKIAASPAAGG